MNPSLVPLLAAKVASEIAAREAGHCVRVDNLTEEESLRLADELKAVVDPAVVKVAVLSPSPSGPNEIDVFAAVGLRNDKSHILVLLVHERAAEEASSLDNSFERLPLLDQLTKIRQDLHRDLEHRVPDAPVAALGRAVGRLANTENWIDFLAAVLDNVDDPQAFGANLWRVGLLPHRVSNENVRAELSRNGRLTRQVIASPRVTATPRERLTAAGVGTGEVFERLVGLIRALPATGGARGWAEVVQNAGISFEHVEWAEVQSSDLVDLEIRSFLASGGSRVEAWSKLKMADDGALFCEVPEEGSGTVGLRWRTNPATPADVDKWLIELVPPEDLRTASTEPVLSMRIPASRRTAKISIDLTSEDLSGGALFVVRLSALDGQGACLALSDESVAVSESEQFELVFVDRPEDERTRAFSSGSMPEAQLRAVISGSDSTDVDMKSWDRAGQVLTARVGGRTLAHIRLPHIPVALEQKLRADPQTASLQATSNFGETIRLDDLRTETLTGSKAFLKRRKEIFGAFDAAGSHSVIAHAWTPSDRDLAREYVSSYRKALQTADAESRAALQAIDSVAVTVGSAVGDTKAVVVLPTHPLRAAWFAALSEVTDEWSQELIERLKSAASRQKEVDLRLMERVSPANLPFSVARWVDDSAQAFTYFDELSVGVAAFVEPGLSTPEEAAASLATALGMNRESRTVRHAGNMLGARLTTYRKSHPQTTALQLALVNPGAAHPLAQALETNLAVKEAEKGEETAAQPSARVIAYGRATNYLEPIAGLSSLQGRLRDIPGRRAASHLVPPLSLAIRGEQRVTEDDESFHVAVAQDVATQELTALGDHQTSRMSGFHDLLSPLVTVRVPARDAVTWVTAPALTARGDSIGSVMVDAHRSQQEAVGDSLTLSGLPALIVSVPPDGLAALRSLHRRADWVLTLDRYLGLDFYENALEVGLSSDNFILDYAPDFIEGLSHRLTVTTAHRTEVESILRRAMDDLGLAEVENSVSPILDHLMKVSGRLVLRLQSSDGFAREAVSLAAVMAHLSRRGELQDTIVVPVDAHDEIFGRAARSDDDEPARRCDMLLVRVTSRSIRIECVEVKSRQAAALPQQLAEGIADQLNETRRLLENRYFASDPARVDRSLQRARLAGLLHYYADRAVTNGLIDPSKIDDVHKNLDRLLDSNAPTELSMRGFVISLAGSAGFPKKVEGIPIAVLTADDLGQAGFSTKFDAFRAGHQSGGSGTVPTPPGGLQSRAVSTETAVSEARASAVAHADKANAHSPHAVDAPSDSEAETSSAGVVETRDSSELVNEPTQSISSPPRQSTVLLGTDSNGSEVHWSISTQGSPHAFVLGIPGQGKSVTTRRIVREFAQQGLPSLLFDFHGDMAANPPAGASVLDVEQGLPFSPFESTVPEAREINMASWEIAEIMAYVASLGEIQRGNVYKALQNSYAAAHAASADALEAPSMSDFAAALEEVEAAGKGRNARERLRTLTDFGLFADDAEDGSFEPRGGGMVVDLSRLNLEEVQRAGSAFLLRKVYRDMFTWPQDGTLKLAIVLDEAHRVARDVTLPKLMKEGRKYGVAVLVASQGIDDFHKDVLGNAGTKIVFRTNFPASRPVAGLLRGRAGQDLSEQIEKLGVGQAYVATPDSPRARRVSMME